VEEDAQVNDLGPNAVFPYTLHLCLKSKSMLCFVLGLWSDCGCDSVRRRRRSGSVYLTERLPVPTWTCARGATGAGVLATSSDEPERSTTNSQLGSQTEILPFLVFSDSNLLTNFPVESPASEALQSLCEGRNGVPSIQIHETRLEVYTHTERAVLKEESDSRNERDVVLAAIRAARIRFERWYPAARRRGREFF
jgi:hypothetical protein